jgi:lantibiotic modifying enzyme
VARIFEVKQLERYCWAYIQKKYDLKYKTAEKTFYYKTYCDKLADSLRDLRKFWKLQDIHEENFVLANNRPVLIDLGCVVLKQQ